MNSLLGLSNNNRLSAVNTLGSLSRQEQHRDDTNKALRDQHRSTQIKNATQSIGAGLSLGYKYGSSDKTKVSATKGSSIGALGGLAFAAFSELF